MTERQPDPTYTPSNLHVAGAIGRTSTSYFRLWAICRLEWALHYLLPHPDHPPLDPATYGIEPLRHGLALSVGKHAHTALELYRLSGWDGTMDTGHYDMGPALAEAFRLLEADITSGAIEATDEDIDKARAQLVTILQKYDEERDPDTDWRLAAHPETGAPMTEAEVTIPLMGGRYQYVVKVDAIGITHHGLAAVEYKTTSRFGASPLLKGILLAGQTAGELAVLHQAFPGANIVGVLYELLVKDRGVTSKLPWIERPGVTVVSPASMAKWLSDCERYCVEITWHVAEWQQLVQKGMNLYDAAVEVFSQTGRANGMCIRFNRECDFYSYCSTFEHGTMALKAMQPRIPHDHNNEGESDA